jgi:hypothetical protein
MIATEYKIPADDVRSLVWEGDELVDWAGGERRFSLQGTITPPKINYAYLFDAAIASPSGEFVALVVRTGTKALLLHRGKIVRQLNRDFYHAEVYPYPLTFGRLTDGREVLIHCPESYCQLEIEDIVTGERLKSIAERKPSDIFQSGLSVSPNGRWLLSNGWVWHPVEVAELYDLESAARDTSSLDKPMASPPGSWEIGTAAFVDNEHIVVGTTDEFFGDENDPKDDLPGKHAVGVWKIGEKNYMRSIKLAQPPGTLMSIGADYVVTFYGHPRMYAMRTGELLEEWPHIDSGQQTGSITWSNLPPPIALQPERARFAVASKSEIYVVEIDLKALPQCS